MAITFKTNQNLINTGFNQTSGQTLSLSGNTLIGKCGTLKYSSNQHNKYTALSIVDASYVTGKTSAICNVGSNQQVIYRDINGITGATNFTYNKLLSGGTVTLPNLTISIAPPDDLVPVDYLLSWDTITGQVKKICYSLAVGLSSAANGLTAIGGTVYLGGLLTQDTTICGSDIYSLRFNNLCNACIITTANNIVLDNRNNSGGIYLKSQNGAINSPVSNYTNTIGVVMDYPSNIFKIYDNRVGVNQKGIEYDNNYSTFYTARSVVDKGYVDAVVSGLQPHAAVIAATTGDTALTGLVPPVIIDGVTLIDTNRVLIKDQTDARQNGIYVFSGSSTSFVRAIDFNESSESVQGAYTFVLSGNTNENTSWVLSTPAPILLNTTNLTFTLFSHITDIVAGHGINIAINSGQHTISVDGQSLVGNSILWTGGTFNVDITGGTLSTALNSKLNILTFSGYTGTTQSLINLAITGATNGLSVTGKDIKLGGDLTGNTNITGAYDFGINVTTLNLTGSSVINLTGLVTLQSAPPSGTTTDSLLVWNNIDKNIKQIPLNIVNVCNVNNVTSYTATTNNSFIGVSGTSCIYLLPNPTCGQRLSVADICGNALSSPITIDGYGKRINDGVSTCSTINTNYGSITFIYNGYFWSAVAFTN